MLQDSTRHARDDMQARALREQQVEAGQLLEAVQHALDQDGDNLLDEAGKARIQRGMDSLRVVLQTADHLAIKREIGKLNNATMAFAQSRMDKSVAQAFGGKKLSDLEI